MPIAEKRVIKVRTLPRFEEPELLSPLRVFYDSLIIALTIPVKVAIWTMQLVESEGTLSIRSAMTTTPQVRISSIIRIPAGYAVARSKVTERPIVGKSSGVRVAA